MKIMIVAGGTGGHLYPGIAIARALQGHEVRFVVRRGDLCRDILMKEGLSAVEIAGQGLPRVFSTKVLSFPFAFMRGWFEAREVLQEFKPDWVLGMGGYLSVPVILNARLLKIHTLLHEQNILPGLANRLLSRWSESVAISFHGSSAYFPKNKTWLSGLPVRSEIGTPDREASKRELGFDPSLPLFLVFGGSQGARRLNELFIEVFRAMRDGGLPFQVLHITGSAAFAESQAGYRDFGKTVKVIPYCHTMAAAYAAADWVVGRSGASTIAELLAAKRPSTLVPFPYASNNHQFHNARYLQGLGMAEIILEKDIKSDILAGQFRQIIENPKRRQDIESLMGRSSETSWGRGAAKRLADFITHPHTR